MLENLAPHPETEELCGATLSQNSAVVPSKHWTCQAPALPVEKTDVPGACRPAAVPPPLVTSAPGFQGRTAWGISRRPLPCSPICTAICSASSGTRRNLRNDLLVAADSITNTMSSLVKELHSGETQSSPPVSTSPVPTSSCPLLPLGTQPFLPLRFPF